MIASIGDLHLDKLNKIYGPEINKIVCQEALSIGRLAVEAGATLVVLLGDLSDEPEMSDESKGYFIRMLKGFNDLCETHIIMGNHDYEHKRHNSLHVFNQIKSCGLWFNQVHIHEVPATVRWNKRNLDMLPYPHDTPLSKNSICFAHLERAGCIRDNGSKVLDGVEPSDRTFIVGHLHTAQTVGSWHWPGTFYQTNFGESSDKYWGLYDTEFKLMPFESKIQLRTLEVSKDSVDSVQSTIENSGEYHRFRLILNGDVRIDHPKVIKTVRTSKVQVKPQAIERSSSVNIERQLRDYCVSAGMTRKAFRNTLKYLESR